MSTFRPRQDNSLKASVILRVLLIRSLLLLSSLLFSFIWCASPVIFPGLSTSPRHRGHAQSFSHSFSFTQQKTLFLFSVLKCLPPSPRVCVCIFQQFNLAAWYQSRQLHGEKFLHPVHCVLNYNSATKCHTLLGSILLPMNGNSVIQQWVLVIQSLKGECHPFKKNMFPSASPETGGSYWSMSNNFLPQIRMRHAPISVQHQSKTWHQENERLIWRSPPRNLSDTYFFKRLLKLYFYTVCTDTISSHHWHNVYF